MNRYKILNLILHWMVQMLTFNFQLLVMDSFELNITQDGANLTFSFSTSCHEYF